MNTKQKIVWFPFLVQWTGWKSPRSWPYFGVFTRYIGRDKDLVARCCLRIHAGPLHVIFGQTLPKKLAYSGVLSIHTYEWQDDTTIDILENRSKRKRYVRYFAKQRTKRKPR